MIKRGNFLGAILEDRKGIELAISTLVLMIIAIVLLITLIVAFTGGWKQLWQKFTELSVSDVDVVKSACENACSFDNEFDYCCRQREVNFGAGKEKINCTDERLSLVCEINCGGAC